MQYKCLLGIFNSFIEHLKFTLKSSLAIGVVIPCFNEEKYLLQTCISLGFGRKESPSQFHTLLFIIDNNSTDSTLLIANQIQKSSCTNTVFFGYSYRQGIVQTREIGNILAKNEFSKLNYNLDEVFILQADADTIYSPGYIDKMGAEALRAARNILFQSLVDYNKEFKDVHSTYLKMCEEVDKKYELFYSFKIDDDLIIDDKAAGYWLNDYLCWGGHKQEFDFDGNEVYAETTRLFIKARTKGAKRVIVSEATAFHSERKILLNPIQHFISAGFPHHESWFKKLWRLEEQFYTLATLHSFRSNNPSKAAIRLRELHIIALFIILPIHVNATLGQPANKTNFEMEILKGLPHRRFDETACHPARLIEDVFELIKKSENQILNLFATL